MNSSPEGQGPEQKQEGLYLDVLAQLSGLNRLYTQLTYCFQLADDTADTRTNIIFTLRHGLQCLHSAFPWVAGYVVHDDKGFKIEVGHNEPCLLIKNIPDCSWDTLRNARLPYHLLDEDTIAPLPTLNSAERPLPVLLLQANLIVGGLLLTFNAQHGSMDMAGQAEMIRLYAKACRNEQFTEDELHVGNMRRQSLIPLLECPSVSYNGEPDQKQHTTSSRLTWVYITFTAEALSSIKDLAMKGVPEGMFVSTDDALSAMLWQATTRARESTLSSSHTSTTLSRNVDVRQHFSIPSAYPGFAVYSATHTWNVDALVRASLGSVAIELRRALDPTLLRQGTQRLATAIHHSGTTGVSAAKVSELEVRLSSWAKEDCYNHNFGPGLGKPEFVRRPRFSNGARDGLIYFLPKSRDGDITVGVCVNSDNLQRLREDYMIATYGSYVG